MGAVRHTSSILPFAVPQHCQWTCSTFDVDLKRFCRVFFIFLQPIQNHPAINLLWIGIAFHVQALLMGVTKFPQVIFD
jgi:hypothetical protein